MLRQRFLRIGWFGEVVLQNLLPVAQQAALEHVAELGEALDIVQVDPFGPKDEIRDSSVESKLDSEAARILGDFGLVSVARIIALQLVDLVEFGLCVPFAGQLKERLFSWRY